MISKHYIDKGVEIRKSFLSVNKKLDNILGDIKKVGSSLEKLTEELQRMSDGLDEYGDVEMAKISILGKLNEVEKQGNRLSSIYKPVNDELEELKNQEEMLYQTIKETYPNLTDDQIVIEFEPYIKKINT